MSIATLPTVNLGLTPPPASTASPFADLQLPRITVPMSPDAVAADPLNGARETGRSYAQMLDQPQPGVHKEDPMALCRGTFPQDAAQTQACTNGVLEARGQHPLQFADWDKKPATVNLGDTGMHAPAPVEIPQPDATPAPAPHHPHHQHHTHHAAAHAAQPHEMSADDLNAGVLNALHGVADSSAGARLQRAANGG